MKRVYGEKPEVSNLIALNEVKLNEVKLTWLVMG